MKKHFLLWALLTLSFFLFSSVPPLHAEPPILSSSGNLRPNYIGNFQIENAFDGESWTRWTTSTRGNPKFIQIDFREVIPINDISIVWEFNCYPVNYDVLISDDAKSWRKVASNRGSSGYFGGETRHQGLATRGRYVRINLTGRIMFSIWEIRFSGEEANKKIRELVWTDLPKNPEKTREARKLLKERYGVEEIVFAMRKPYADPHWYANIGYYSQNSERKTYRRGGLLCRYNFTTGKLTPLLEDRDGTIRDPAVSYDAKKILFSWRKGGEEDFHLWEINVDGSGLRQITRGPFSDIEPAYLPDGGYIFASNRGFKWVNCWATQVATIHRCDADGSNLRELSANIEHDNTPWMLPDGRVLYTRWEYVDRSQMRFHQLWTMNPDGTGQMVYYGNQEAAGSVYIDAKPIPGTDDILIIDSPVHGMRGHAGWVARISPKKGPDDKGVLHHINPTIDRVRHRDYHYAAGTRKMMSKWHEFRDPYPLSADHFIVACNFKSILLMDKAGTETVIYRQEGRYADEGYECQEPRPLIPRKRERQIPPRTDWSKSTGRLILADVHTGRKMQGIAPGTVKKLLVLETLPKPINFSGGMEPITSGGTFTLERILGTVPVEEDGSAYMELPANRPLFFVALDKENNAVKRMHSFTSVVPGETTGCVGCHEHRTETPEKREGKGIPMAVRRPPSKPTPLEGIPDIFDFPRDIQPILDRHCVKCHNPDNRQGRVLMTGDRGPLYSNSFMTLTERRQILDGRNAEVSNFAPYAIGAGRSPLMLKILNGHHGVKMTPREIDYIRYWIESGAAYPGTYAALGTGMIGGFNFAQTINNDTYWPTTRRGTQAIQANCARCHPSRWSIPKTLSDYKPTGAWYSRDILFNLTRPEKSPVLMAPLAKEAGGYADKVGENKWTLHPIVFKDKNAPGYKAILAMLEEGKRKLEEVTRFDMPNFKPHPAYIREMKRYGVLSPEFDLEKDRVDVYKLDDCYWRDKWYAPDRDTRPHLLCPYEKGGALKKR